MLNELERPTLNISLDLDIPKMEPLKHDLDKVEIFAKKLDAFYRDAIEKSDDLDIRLVKQERTKVRKVIKTIEDNRKAMVKAYKEPIKDFEDTSKRIEKILKGTDGMMKELVDADKAANEDPFGGLSVDDKTYRVTFSSSFENYLKVRKYLEKLGIIVKLEEEL